MGKYTDFNEKVDDYIKKNYLDKIVASFVRDCKPISIILFGGFGKGEGSLQVTDGKPVPFNDFDLYIVTEKKLSADELKTSLPNEFLDAFDAPCYFWLRFRSSHAPLR
mgnify:CR=1 FL=1